MREIIFQVKMLIMIQTLGTKIMDLITLLLGRFLRSRMYFLQEQMLQHVSCTLMTWETPAPLSYPNVYAHRYSGWKSDDVSPSVFKGHGPEQKLCLKT